MNLCVSLYSLHPYLNSGEMNVADALEFLHAQGVEYVELLDSYLSTPEIRTETKRLLEQYHMKAGAYAASNEFADVTAAELEGQIFRLQNACRIAAEFGTHVVRVFAGNISLNSTKTYEQSVKQIIASLKQCIPAALEQGVTLCLENHGLLAGKSGQVRAILEGVDSPAMKATVDTGNFLLVGETPSAAVQALTGYTGHVHFKDMKRTEIGGFAALDGRRYIGTPLGRGEVDLSQIIELLHKNGFDGCISIEYEAPEKDGCREALMQSIRYTQSLLKSIR